MKSYFSDWREWLQWQRWFKDPARVLAIVRLLINDLERCDLFRHASAMAYVTVFSIIPCLAAVTALVTSFSPLISQHYDAVSIFNRIFTTMTPAAITDIIEYIKGMMNTIDFKAMGASGILALFVSLAFLLRQIEIAFNRIWLVKKPRSLIKRFLYFWTFSTLSLFALSLGLAMFANYKLDALLADTAGELVNKFSFFSILINWAITFLVFGSLYKVIPNCNVRFADAAMGGLLATICFQIVTKFYTFFITSMANYRTLYGTLAALPTFLLWLYISWLITMIGALFAWRWSQGFPHDKDKQKEESFHANTSDPETFKQRIWATFMSLLLIHEAFERSKTRISISEIAKLLSLPIQLVDDQVDVLMNLKMVAIVSEGLDDDVSPMERSLLPTQSANKISVFDCLTAICGTFEPSAAADEVVVRVTNLCRNKLARKQFSDLKSVYLSEIVES